MSKARLCSGLLVLALLALPLAAQAQPLRPYGLSKHIMQFDLGAAFSLEDQSGNPSGGFMASYSHLVAGPFRLGGVLGASIPEREEILGVNFSATFGYVGPFAELRFWTPSNIVPRLYTGVAYYTVSLETNFGLGTASLDDKKIGYFFGGGADFKVSPKVGIGASMQMHNVNFGSDFADIPSELGWYNYMEVRASLGLYF